MLAIIKLQYAFKFYKKNNFKIISTNYIYHIKMIVFIQARSNSKRFRNKILKKIYGLPIIMHKQGKKAKLVKDFTVATQK